MVEQELTYILRILELQIGKRIYWDGRVGENKDLLGYHLKGMKMMGSWAKDYSATAVLIWGWA
jgi:hypothetical protein